MSTLAQLVVELSANTARFESGLLRAESLTKQFSSGITSAVNVAKASLAGLASAFTLDAVLDYGKGVVAAAESLNNLAASTGSSVESLSRLSNQAQIAGTDFGTFQGFLFKMNKSLAESKDSTTDATRALAYLGVTAKDPATALQQVITAMSGYENGIGKAALATALFGKNGQDFLATLDNMAKLGDVQATVTTKQAEEAEKLEIAIRRLGIESTALKNIVLSDVVPALNTWIDQFIRLREVGGIWYAFLNANTNNNNLDPQIKDLTADIERYKKAIDTVHEGQRLGIVTPEELNSLPIYEADLAKATTKLQAFIAMRDKAFGGADNKSGVGDETRWGSALRSAVQQQAQFALGANSTSKAVDEVSKSLQSMIDSLERSLASEMHLTEVDKLFVALQNGKIDGLTAERKALLDKALATAQSVDKQREDNEAIKKSIEVAAERNREFDKELELIDARNAALEKSIRSVRESVENAEFEVQTMQMSNTERIKAIMLRDAERAGIDTTTESFGRLIQRMQDAAQTKDLLQGQIDLWHSIDSAAHDAFMHIFESGKSVFDRLRDSLKSGLLEVLYQLTVKRWILNIGASVSGNAGVLNGLQGGSSLLGGGGASGGSPLGLLGSIGSIFTAGGTIGTSFAAAGANIGLAASAGLDAVGGISGLAAGILPAISALVPFAALAAIAIPLIVGAFDKGPANRTGDFGSNLGSYNPDFRGSSKFGSFGIANDSFFSLQEMGPALQNLIKTVGGLDNAISAAVGPDRTAAIRAALSGSANYSFGTEHTDLNASGAIGSILKDRYIAVLNVLDTRLASVFDKFQGTGDEMGQFLVSLIGLDDLLKSIPSELSGRLLGALDGTTDSLQHVAALAGSISSVADLMNRDPLSDALDAIAGQNATAYTSFLASAKALRAQLDANDDTTAGINALTNATGDYYRAQVQLLAQIDQVQKSISDMFGDTIRSLTLTTLDNPGKYAYLQNEADKLRDQLVNTSDPQRVQELAGRINDDINAAFGLLDPDTQRALLSQYTSNVNDLNDLVAQRLQEIRDDTTESVGDTLREVSDRLTSLVGALADAGVVQQQAAQTQLQAAQTPIQITVNNPTSELVPG